MPLWRCAGANNKDGLRLSVIEGGGAEGALAGIRGCGRGAHKTKQATTKHLALLASLGMSGLSVHMAEVE